MSVADEQPRRAWLGRAAFALIVAIVLSRCLMLTALRDSDAGGADAPFGPGAAVTLTLDWLSLLPVVLLLLRRLFDDRFTLRFTLVHALFVALAGWTLASAIWADDKFAALVGGMDLCAASAIFWSVGQLVRRWDQFRVVAGVAVAVLLANVAQGVIYETVEFPALRDMFQRDKDRILRENGWRPGDYAAERFEKKVLAGELMGFNASPNTMAAICVLGALVAVGAAAQRTADRDDPGWTGVLWIAAATCAYPLGHSGSKAAWSALALGLAAIGFWRLTRRWLDVHRPFVFAAGCVGIALAIAGVIVLGLTRGGLPTDSLNFRWRYWAGAWPLLMEHPLAGVGWGNFGSHYLAHRLPPAAEEIQDPHNLFVRWATELGLVGLCLGVAWLGVFAWRAARTPRRGRSGITTPSAVSVLPPAPNASLVIPGGGTLGVKALLGAVALAFLLNVACTIDFGLGSGDGANYAIIELLKRAVLFGAVALAIGAVTLAAPRRAPGDRDPAPAGRIDARPAPWLAAAAFVGVAMLIVQSAIDIVLFEPGPLALAATLMGALIGLAVDDRRARPNAQSLIALITAGVVMLALLVAIVIPTTVAEATARRGDRFAARQPARAIELYDAADRWSPVANWSHASKAARVAMLAGDPRAGALLDRTIAADPSRASAYLDRARFRLTRQPADPAAVVADYDRALALNPNDVDVRLEYADALARLGRPREASEQIFRALAADDALDEAEPERLDLRTPGTRDALQRRAATLQAGR